MNDTVLLDTWAVFWRQRSVICSAGWMSFWQTDDLIYISSFHCINNIQSALNCDDICSMQLLANKYRHKQDACDSYQIGFVVNVGIDSYSVGAAELASASSNWRNWEQSFIHRLIRLRLFVLF